MTAVTPQTGRFKTSPEFQCPVHGIVIGKSTFEYLDETDNLLWTGPADLERLRIARASKRESRMARERSEDAVTWNAFRHLEAGGRLASWASSVTGQPESGAEVHYWSSDAQTGRTWEPLAEARYAFRERDGRGTEPDLVITTDEAHIWVEAKLGSPNTTRPTDLPGARDRYTAGGSGWYSHVVAEGLAFDAIADGRLARYELLRMWLLGSWAAAHSGKRFELVNLVCEGREEDVPALAKQHFRQTPMRRVHRVTWESLYGWLAGAQDRSAADVALLAYMKDKSLGYDASGKLVTAFALTAGRPM